jgi:hypothetical protein
MSQKAIVTLAVTAVATIATISYVHYLQKAQQKVLAKKLTTAYLKLPLLAHTNKNFRK